MGLVGQWVSGCCCGGGGDLKRMRGITPTPALNAPPPPPLGRLEPGVEEGLGTLEHVHSNTYT